MPARPGGRAHATRVAQETTAGSECGDAAVDVEDAGIEESRAQTLHSGCAGQGERVQRPRRLMGTDPIPVHIQLLPSPAPSPLAAARPETLDRWTAVKKFALTPQASLGSALPIDMQLRADSPPPSLCQPVEALVGSSVQDMPWPSPPRPKAAAPMDDSTTK
ncbi:hypothetical protein BKA66DRAFT_572173 [Pyrenochaeta sp. MPI-SDFR-AT-0127]|nr:hypothetical protein BKA66DRAFT_572173 [Pyrenochaeta sp. MPI-SDFR-AT-0127]